jgi:hypothetical protein
MEVRTVGAARVRSGFDRSDTDPWQMALYRAAGRTVEARSASVEAALEEDPRGAHPLIYHLCWEADALGSGREAERRARGQALLDGLDALRSRGDHVVWTRIEAVPHDPATAELYCEMMPHLTALASVIHVPSYAALDALGRHDRLDLS